MITRALTFFWFAFIATAPQAEEIVLGMSQDEVAITASFTGSEILIFGAVRRDAPAPESSQLEVIIAVQGPNVPVTVRKKERVAGIWVNTSSIDLDIAPSFYAVATSGEIGEVLLPLEDLRHAVSVGRVVRSAGQDAFATDNSVDAFARIQAEDNLVQILEGAVKIDEQTLFRTRISLPANITEGDYKTRIFLTRNGMVVDQLDTIIPVYKVGIERWLYKMSQEQAAIYGALSLAIAALAGWMAAAIFGRLRG